ncbi:hypothetical protein, partial [Klebsiella aerogenes]|uniref:hypothetical protein n=1 Tax=Klebsiella aerogenes TaxID=548 RepID=UPI001953309E
ITHVAGEWDSKAATPLVFNAPGNLDLWADWVRASVYLTDFVRDLDWTICGEDEAVAVGYRCRKDPDDWTACP